MRKPFSTKLLSGRNKAFLSGVALTALVAASGVQAGFAQNEPAKEAPVAAQTLQNGAPVSFADIVDQVRPAVVNIQVKTDVAEPQLTSGNFDDLPPNHPLRRFFEEFGGPRGFDRGGERGQPHQGPRHRQATSLGSGFIISDDGYVVTNNHVVENGTEVQVVLYDGKTYDAEVIGTDPMTDLALLKIDADEKFATVPFAKEAPRVGDWVLAMGNPFGLGGTATAGIVSANGRDIKAGPYDDFIQIDAAVNRGNSGGPTFNLKGEVIGVNSMIFSPSGGNVGIAFAIPANMTEKVVADLKDDGSVERGWLGVRLQPMTDELAEGFGEDEPVGALVNNVQPGSPADAAGLKAGDIVTSVNGNPVKDARDLARAIGGMEPGDVAKLELTRDGQKNSFAVRLGDMSKAQELQRS